MSTMAKRWSDMQAYLFDRLDSTLNADPRVLLEADGGPVGRTADVILARLYERDGQVVREMRLSRVEPEVLVPIPRRLSAAMDESDPTTLSIRTARFVLQSSYAVMEMTGEHAPPDVKVGPPTFTFSVLFVRYRRRS